MVPGFRMRPAPVASGRLKGEEFGPPTFRCDAGPLGRNRVGVFIGEVTHDLPADGRVRIEDPLDVCGPRCVIVEAHWSLIANERGFDPSNRLRIDYCVWQKAGENLRAYPRQIGSKLKNDRPWRSPAPRPLRSSTTIGRSFGLTGRAGLLSPEFATQHRAEYKIMKSPLKPFRRSTVAICAQ